MELRAWSLLEVKSVSEEERILRGMATTPTVDRVGDIVEPMGMTMRGSIKLHLYHKHDLPVGHVTFGKPTRKGIPFEATIPDVKEDGTVRDRVNEAWHSVKYRLLDAVSIGFRVLEDGAEVMRSGGYRFKKWEMLELSLVGVPANPDAVITAFKSANPNMIRSSLGIPRDPASGILLVTRSQPAKPVGGAIKLITR